MRRTNIMENFEDEKEHISTEKRRIEHDLEALLYEKKMLQDRKQSNTDEY